GGGWCHAREGAPRLQTEPELNKRNSPPTGGTRARHDSPSTGVCSASRRRTGPPTRASRPSSCSASSNTRKQSKPPWRSQVSTCSPQEALHNLDHAFAHVFRRVKLKRAGKLRGKVGSRRLKTKKRRRGGFRLTSSIVVEDDALHLPRLGRLR